MMTLSKLPVLPAIRILVDLVTGLSRNEWHDHFDAVQKNLRFGGGREVYGTHAERADPLARGYLKPGFLPDGSIFVETDRGNVRYQVRAGAWVYLSGFYARTQSQLSALAATLGTADAGLLVEVTDYRHVLKWSGSAWGWGPGDTGSGMIQPFSIDPNPTTGWQLCDGTANVPYLKSDGTTATFSTPNLAASPAYLKFAGSVSGPTAASAPTLTNPTVASAATGVSVNAAATGISLANNNASTNATVIAGNGFAASPHNHTVTDPTHAHPVTDPQHSHTLSGGSVAADGEPAHYNLKPWFRQ